MEASINYDLRSQYEPGDTGVLHLYEEEVSKKRTIRNRLRAAAKRQGLTITFFKTGERDALRFIIEEGDDNASGS